MDTVSPPPSPSPDLLQRFVEYAQQTFIPALESFYAGGTAHVGTVSVVPDDMMPANVGAFFVTATPDGTVLEALAGGRVTPITAMYVTMNTAITVAAALEGNSTLLADDLRREVLSEFKTELKFVVHEATHAVGPAAIQDFDDEVEKTARCGLGAWKEAVTELATQRNLDALIRAAGLDRSDPLLLDVDSRDTGSYVGMVEAAEVIVKGLSALIPGADADIELRNMVASGSGRTGLDRLLGRAFQARGCNQPARADRARNAVAETLRGLDRQYKRTLAALDGADDVTVTRVLARLSAEGARQAERCLDQINAIIASPTAPLPSARQALDARSLDLKVRQHLGNRGRPSWRLDPRDPAAAPASAGVTLDLHE